MKHIFLFVFLILFTVSSYGQNYKLSADDPQQFVVDARALMVGTKNEAALQATTGLETAWASGKISAAQKTRVMSLSQQMLKKKLKSRPHFESFWTLLASSVNQHQYTGANLDQLLTVTEKTLQKQDVKSFERFLQNSNQFLSTKAVYTGPNNTLRVSGGTFAFEYREEGGNNPAATDTNTKGEDPWAAWETPKKSTAAEEDPWATWGASKKKQVKATPKKSTKTTAKSTKTTAQKAVPPVKTEPVAPPKETYIAAPLPVLTGPVIVLQNADLLFSSPADSATIKGTSGTLSLGTNRMVGQGGKFTWNRLGGDATADLKGYALKTDNPGFRAEDVTLHYPAVLDNDIHGNLEYKLEKEKANGESIYPKFISHTNDAKISKFGADVRYVGGMSVSGKTLMTAALDASPSTIWVSSAGKPKFRTWARNFTINDSLLSATVAGVTMFQGQDSITHPGVQFKYNKDAKRLVLVDADGVFKSTPYLDTYHKMELSSSMATWNVDKPEIDFGMLLAKSQVPAQVNSQEYYAESRFQQIKTIANFHPLYTAVGYSLQRGSRSYYISELAQESKLKEETLHLAMTILAQGRYVDYDPVTGYVTVQNKAYHYVDASRNKKDYDFIQLNSIMASGKNATLDMNTGDMVLRGVKRFAFTSDSNAVYAEPDSQTVRIQKNRNILFNGKVVSSNFTFKGEEFLFDYDGFFINLAKIDSTIFTTKAKDKKGKEKSTDFALVNRNGRGSAKLYLNRPDNKSGRKKYAGYPALDAVSGAVVYFNKPEILGGVYDTSVYFSIPPFKIDSLASGNQTALALKGTFYSGGIFAPFETKLSIMPDGALGFKQMVGKSGVELYGGKGRFNDTLTMDTKGLHGNGTIKYQTATLHSPAFVFYKDSVITKVGTKGSFTEGSVAQGSYPSGSLKTYTMKWRPYRDTLQVNTRGRSLMSMYNDRFTYKGMLGFTPVGLFGEGVMENKEVALKSPAFKFTKGLIHGNRASMEIASTNRKKPMLSTYDIFLDFHLDKGYAEYAQEQKGFVSTVLPFAQYKSSLGGGRWDLKKRKLTLTSGIQDSSSAYFYSMKSGQDSIRFKARNAEYDFDKNSLVATGVPYIAVGDSYIIPDDNRVQILENASLKEFTKAGLAMDSVQKYHHLVRGQLHLDNNVGMTGTALYPFASGQDTTYVKFSNFTWNQVDKKSERKGEVPYFQATAKVEESDTLFIMPNVRYYGDIKMASNQKYMSFDGFAKMMVGDNKDAEWIPFKRDNLDPNDVQLEVKKSTDVASDIVASGIHISSATGKIYNTFVSRKQDNSDLDVFEAQGQLSFDKENNQYKLGDANRAAGKSYIGNVLRYNEVSKKIAYEGRFKLMEPVRGFNLQASGNGTGRTDSSSYRLDTFMALDIEMPSQALETMAQNVRKAVEGAPEAIDLNNPTLPYKLAEFIGDKGVEDFKTKTARGYVPLSQISPKLMHSLVLNDVQMKWSAKNNAWYSVGPIGLASIEKSDINSRVNGHIEIKRGASGDAVAVYLEPTPYVWYFFNFYEGALAITSSDDQFNNQVTSKSNGGPGTGTYAFYPVEEEQRVEFVNYFRKAYLGQGPMKAVAKPINYDAVETAEEDTSGDKKAKKKKGKEAEAVDVPPAGFEAPVEEPAKKKEKKKVTESAPAPDIPTAEEPVQDTSKKKKKTKKEEKAPPPDIDPVGN